MDIVTWLKVNDVNEQLAEKKSKRMSVKDIVEPFVIAHRGGSNVYPENTLDAYKGIVANGIKIIEQDVQILSDGTIVVMHDTTVDRTTDGTGNVSDYYYSAWKALNIDASNFMGASGYGNAKAPTLDEVFREFGDSIIYAPETKDISMTPKLVSLIQNHKLENNVIIQSFDLSSLQPAIDAGMVTLALGNTVDLTTAKNMGVIYIGHSSGASDTYIQNIINAGMKPVVWTVNTRKDWDNFKSKGVVGCFSDDPLYISEMNTHIRTEDPFQYKTWYHGQLATQGGRGAFIGTNRWGYPSTNIECCLQGWGSPIQQDFYKISFSVTFDEIPTDTGRWGSIALCSDTDYFVDGGEGSNGYHVLFRASGSINIYKVTNGVATSLQTATSTVFTAGGTANFEITVSQDGITVSRTDGTPVTVTANDTIYRGKNFFFAHNGAKVSFSNVSIV